MEAALAQAPRLYPLFLAMQRTGLRIGEALALKWDDLDLSARAIRVERAISNEGVIGTPKSGHGRTVDMSTTLRDVLQRHHATLAAAWLRRKPEKDENGQEKPKGELPPWVFPSDAWTPMDHANIAKAFKRMLKAAGLPPHHSPHSLRHTFASLLLQQGESIQYVQRMLGHASVTLTVDTYGKWLPMGNKAAVDRLDEAAHPPGGSVVVEATSGSPDESAEGSAGQIGGKMVAEVPVAQIHHPQVVDELGDPPWTRTMNPEIKRHSLYSFQAFRQVSNRCAPRSQ